MADKVKITFVLPNSLQRELKERVIKDNYDMKGKSRWVTEAIETLLVTETFPDLVKINDQMKGFEKQESVVIPRDMKKQLEDAIVNVRKIYPEIDGVQSRIVRTAIMQRLLRV